MSRKSKKALDADGSNITVSPQSLQLVEKVNINVRQELIIVTKDKIELCLEKHVKTMEQRQAWIIPFGVFITCVSVLVSATFHDQLYLKAETWHAVFSIGAIAAGVLTITFFVKRRRAKTVSELIDELRAQGIQEETTQMVAGDASAIAGKSSAPLPSTAA